MRYLEDFLKNHPECESVRDALLSWEKDMERLRQENATLVNSVETLKEQIADQDQEIEKTKEIPKGFLSAHGVLWLIGADGSVDKLAYCPKCKLVMMPFPSNYPEHLVCTSCKYKAPFEYTELNKLWDEISE